ncbi:hypothetical protein [Streptomyces sp. NPDC046939]|uniref:hypothetical protein n=1 Tax=Streptomyces sp. NPDC046939 TaxID=3155376 RepID=UPI0033D60DE8
MGTDGAAGMGAMRQRAERMRQYARAAAVRSVLMHARAETAYLAARTMRISNQRMLTAARARRPRA